MKRNMRLARLDEEVRWQCLYGTPRPPAAPAARRRLFLLQRFLQTSAQAACWLAWAERQADQGGEQDHHLIVALTDHSLWLHLREGRTPDQAWCQRAATLLELARGRAEEGEWRWRWLRSLLAGGGSHGDVALGSYGEDRVRGERRASLLWAVWIACATGDEEEWHRLREANLGRLQRAVEREWLPCWRLELLQSLNREWAQSMLEQARRGAKVSELWQEKAASVLATPRLATWQQRLQRATLERDPHPAQIWGDILAGLQRQEVTRLPRQQLSEFETLAVHALQLVGETAWQVREMERRLDLVEACWPTDWEWDSTEGLARLAQFYLRLGEGYVALDALAEAVEWERWWVTFVHPYQRGSGPLPPNEERDVRR